MNSNLKVYDEKMNKSVDILGKDYAAIRAGRANPAVLDKVTVEYYGTPTPINQMLLYRYPRHAPSPSSPGTAAP